MIHEPVDLPGATTKSASHPEDRVDVYFALMAIPDDAALGSFFFRLMVSLSLLRAWQGASGNYSGGQRTGCGFFWGGSFSRFTEKEKWGCTACGKKAISMFSGASIGAGGSSNTVRRWMAIVCGSATMKERHLTGRLARISKHRKKPSTGLCAWLPACSQHLVPMIIRPMARSGLLPAAGNLRQLLTVKRGMPCAPDDQRAWM